MILTYKIKHGKDFDRELNIAKKVAEYGINSHSISSKDVRHLGLKSIISNQILRKYSKSKTAKKYGVPIAYVEPQYTSQRCSKCGHISSKNRKGKEFHCTSCGMVENADANAGFNIASLYQQGISQFNKERDLLKGNTDIPREAML